MPTAVRNVTDLVLLGAGHAHVEVLRRFALRPEPGVRLVLISQDAQAAYSGMLPGLIRGDYTFDEAHIDLPPLAAAAGARLLIDEAVGIDLAARTVSLARRPPVLFDLLSIDIGGVPAMPHGAGLPVKPVARFLEGLTALEAALAPGTRIAVVGGGAAGSELALALAHRFGERARITLVSASEEPLAEAPALARRMVRAALVDAGVELACGVTAGAPQADRLPLSDGSFIEAAATIWATNVVGPPLLAAAGLACDAEGCVHVRPTLLSVSDDGVFAAGDCAAIEHRKRPKAGVWAVRAGPPLAENLRRAARGAALRPWRPQPRALAILGLGDGRAVAWRDGIALHGRAVARWKDRIDRAWMQRYALSAPLAPGETLRSGGAGAKLGAALLAEVLSELPSVANPDLLIGAHGGEILGARPPTGMALVQSVSHFRALLDDPYVFGEIAAAHALARPYAAGARPWTALAIAAMPLLPADKLRADLSALMRGAAGVLAADGCALIGGQTGEGLEPALGFAVAALVEPRLLWRKSALRAGEALVLTKPLGNGLVLAGHLAGRARAHWLMGALAAMRQTNGTAAQVLRSYGVTACTHVGGFGLIGHLLDMLTLSGVAAGVWPDALPLLAGARELAEQGVADSLSPENRRLLPPGVPEPLASILTDPQTSGGLLAGIPASRAEVCLTALRAAGVEAAIIGETVADPADCQPGALVLRPGASTGG